MPQLNLMIDLERCIGCKSCEAACKQVNRLGPSEYRTRVQWLGDAEAPDLDFLTVTCQQCERPACLRACPVTPKALSKDPDTGVVAVDESRCTGCGECVVACPYGAMGYDPVDHHAVKCDLCAPRRAAGDGPACVSVCPTNALSFGTHDALLEQAEAEDRSVRDHDHFLQGPGTIILDRLPKPQDTAEAPRDPLVGKVAPRVLTDNAPRQRLSAAAQAPYRAPLEDTKADRVRPGGCNICFNGCTLKYHLRGNRVVNVLGNEDDPVFRGKVCPKSQMTLQMYDNPERLTRPLKRIDERGADRFEAISWDQALDEIAAKLRALRARHGPEALAIFMGTRTGVLTIMGYARLFQQLWGTPNYLTTQSFCDEGKVIALNLTQGSTNLANVYTEADIGSAALHLYVGDNQAETRPVNFGLINDWRVKRGARIIAVDPRLTATASKADRWLAIRPGTDMALGLALIHYLFEADLHDAAFCQDWVLGWEAWRDYVREKGYTPDWAASVTGLASSEIRELAEAIAGADGCMIYASRGINQHSNAVQTNRVLMFLAAMTGNWGRQGGGYFNVAAEPDWQPMRVPEARRPLVSKAAVGNSVGRWLDAMLDDDPYPVRALLTSNNPLAQWPDQGRSRKALANLDLIVHIELFHNETSSMADYVLPAASGIEKGGISRLAEDRRVVWNDRMIDPPGEAKSDHWFWIELGKRLGYDDILEEKYKDPGVFWDEVFRPATPDLMGATLRRLRSVPYRWVRTPVRSEGHPEPGTLYLEGTTAFGQTDGKRFPTASGQLELWTPALEERFRALGLSALPEFYTDDEQLIDLPYITPEVQTNPERITSPFLPGVPVGRSRINKEGHNSDGARLREQGFDTELVTGRPPAPQFHSWTHYFWQAQEMWPDLFCQIHPDKAESLGVADGQPIRIESATGSIRARAWITRGIRSSAVFVPIGWDEKQPYHPWRGVNHITKGKRDPISEQANLKVHLCRVRRVSALGSTSGKV